MLLLTRCPGESVDIGGKATLTFDRVQSVMEETGLKTRLMVFHIDIGSVRSVVSRRVGETFDIGIDPSLQVGITVTENRGQQVRLGFNAPPSVRLLRGELAQRNGKASPTQRPDTKF